MDAPATWSALMGTLVRGEALTADDTAWAMGEIMEGAATPAQIAGFGVALRMKGETAAGAGGRSFRSGHGPGHRRGAGGARLLGHGVPRRRRAGRADDGGHVLRLGGSRRRGQPDRARPRRAGNPAIEARRAARRGRGA